MYAPVQLYVCRFVVVVVIILNISLNFDGLLRSAFLLRHAMQRERNDLATLANPFSPEELEKWCAKRASAEFPYALLTLCCFSGCQFNFFYNTACVLHGYYCTIVDW